MIQELRKHETVLSSVSTTDPIVLCASDDNYVKPLTVMLHSAATNLKSGSHLQIILMDGGISESSWMGLKESLIDLPISIHVLRPDPNEVRDLGISHHITHTAYFRLLAARLLPETIDKVIYLDSDVLVKDDLTELWNLELGEHYALAAVDIACPFVDAYQTKKHRAKNSESNRYLKAGIPYLAAVSPIPNWRELSLDGTQPYFNSGVMVLNIARWRAESIDQTLLACLRDNQQHVWCWDQYALNVVFAKQWGKLPARWNQGAHVFDFPNESCSPIDQADFVEMRDNPALIHFTTEFKPWNFGSSHPLRDEFFKQLDQTAWAGWRPEKPDFDFGRSRDLLFAAIIRKIAINYHKVRGLFNR